VPAIAVQADVSDEAQVMAMFARIDAELPTLHGLVNNAGVVDMQTRVDQLTMQRIQRMFAINVFGSMLCAREGLETDLMFFTTTSRQCSAPPRFGYPSGGRHAS
jgi:NAD(P)-dependent dehydrogenase (short-subunit alcohol dehydrogenase family)